MQSHDTSATASMVKTSTPGIYRKGNRYVVVFRDTTGKQRKRSVRTLAEARTTKAALTADVRRGEYVEEARVTFAAYAVSWIESYGGRTARGVRPRTVRDYRRALGLDEAGQPTGGGAIAYFGRQPLGTIRPQDVKAYAETLAATGAARNTIRLALAPVRAMLADAFEESVIRANPAARLRLGRSIASAPVKETHALTEEELARVLAEVPEAYRPIVTFLAKTGLRVSEALPLTRADVDFGRRRVAITRRLSDGSLDAPKSRHGVRDVPLSPGLARALWTRVAAADDDALLFAGPDGLPFGRSHLYRVVHAAGERAGIGWPVGLHALRHSCASIMFRRGVSKEAIRKMLGHHSWDFTASTYLHLNDDDLPDTNFLDALDVSAQPDAREGSSAGGHQDQFRPGLVSRVVKH